MQDYLILERMDSYYFLQTRSLCNIDYSAYKAGLTELNSLSLEMMDTEKRLKNEAVYQNPLYLQMCGDYAETAVLLQYIEQCTSVDNDIDTDAEFEKIFPQSNAGFLGVNFAGVSGIDGRRQVTNTASFRICRIYFLDNLIKHGKDKDLPSLLQNRFPKFSFTIEAQKDLLWWKYNGNGILDSVIELLDDIPANPFTGGLGKTEVLSNTKTQVVSKRITQEDRLTYTFGDITIIHRCKEHY